jgi:TrpR-related protein YerC/YecD
MKQTINEEARELFRAILSLSSEEECAAFFEDLCTIKEIQDLSQRLQVADMLNRGEKYQTIEQATGASTATISRVNKCLVYGSGGYRLVLDKKSENK